MGKAGRTCMDIFTYIHTCIWHFECYRKIGYANLCNDRKKSGDK